MTEVVLHLGTNIGFRAINLELSEIMLSNHVGNIIASSAIYETAAWGKTDQADFLNKAIICKTNLSPYKTLEAIHLVEAKMGRVRAEHWGPRIIDVDIIFYGEEIIKDDHLKIPHPQLTNRRFVLIPLLDICPNKIHPILKKSVQLLSEECDDQAEVRQFV